MGWSRFQDGAASIDRIDGDLDCCLQVAFILDSLDSPEEEGQATRHEDKGMV